MPHRDRRRGVEGIDRPSLALRWPNGKIAITDDWHHRVLVVDKRTKKVVWSYGHLNQPSTAPGYLNKPDGLDLLPAAITGKPAAAPAPSPVGLKSQALAGALAPAHSCRLNRKQKGPRLRAFRLERTTGIEPATLSLGS
jgi:hypothetical protein